MRPLEAADSAMLAITCPTIFTEIALGAGLPMGQVVSPSRKLDYIFNRVPRMSLHRRLAADVAAVLYMHPMLEPRNASLLRHRAEEDVTLALVGEIAGGPPGPLSSKAVNRDTAYAKRSAP